MPGKQSQARYGTPASRVRRSRQDSPPERAGWSASTLELQLSKQEQPILPGLRITGQDVRPIVRLGRFGIDHPHGGAFFRARLSPSISAPASNTSGIDL